MFMLLAWTAADLAFARVCGLEKIDTPITGGSRQLTVQSDAAQSPGSDLPDVQDCFCCSHCVNIQQAPFVCESRLVSAVVADLIVSVAPPQVRPTYHPPQARA